MFTVVHLIPTGVGAAIGGYAGDAGPVAALLASVCDRLVTHPNAVNAAPLINLPANAWYVEGHALDGWLAGRWVLRPSRGPRIGLVVDRAVEAMPEGSLASVLNAANAVRAVHGIPLVGYRMTDVPLGCRVRVTSAGIATGEVAEPAALLAAARALMAAGATAIAVMADMGPQDPAYEATYQAGGGIDPIGGLEAVLSHLLVDQLGCPAAHAPLMPFDPLPPPIVDPRASAEYIGHSYLPCILQGLARHPLLVPPAAMRPDDLAPEAIDALVVPAGCLGGPAVIAAHARGIPIVAVAENVTVMNVTAEALGWTNGVVPVANYFEAAGLLAAMRVGLDWRTCRRPLAPLEAL